MDDNTVMKILVGLTSSSNSAQSSPKMVTPAPQSFAVGQSDAPGGQAVGNPMGKHSEANWSHSASRMDVNMERDGSTSSGTYSEDSINDEGFQSGSMPSSQELLLSSLEAEADPDGKGKQGSRKSKEDTPATHTHLGGVRHCRIPLAPEIREVLEVAWTSRIIQPGVDGRKEKERIAKATGLSYSKVHEWFRNRRKKAKLMGLRKKGIAPPPKKKTLYTRQQSESSSSSDLSLKFEAACIEPPSASASLPHIGLPTADMLSVD